MTKNGVTDWYTRFNYDAGEQHTYTAVKLDNTHLNITYYPFPLYEEEVEQEYRPPQQCIGLEGSVESEREGVVPDPGWCWVTTQVTRHTIYTLAGHAIATRVITSPPQPTDGLFYFITDHLSSTRLLAAPNSSPVPGTTAHYLPYGDYRGSAPTATPLTERGYTGHHENREIGLTYMNARFYSPTSGRFLTADTLIPSPANPQAHNRYTYSLGNPIRFIDPSGHETVHANLSKDEAQILADAIALLLMEHDSLQVSVIEFLLSHFGPAVLSGATTYAVTEALVAAGFIAAGVVGVGISIGISVIVGAAIAWDKVATQNAMNTLRNVHQSLLNAINIAENTDRISIFAASTWFSSDRVVWWPRLSRQFWAGV